ncbi:MAG: hypothetical protein KAX20_07020 [Candidatus Omnitrophica bacterium]|nr:hypothetical protein [Candidatus Omnitrophota bacterium]
MHRDKNRISYSNSCKREFEAYGECKKCIWFWKCIEENIGTIDINVEALDNLLKEEE